MTETTDNKRPCAGLDVELSRRQFLVAGSATVVTLMLPDWRLGGLSRPVQARLAAYERQKVGQVSQLKVGEPVPFSYPYDHANCQSFLFKLGTPAGGGVGPDEDIVAFNALCTHQGGPLHGRFSAEHQVFGPCPLHLTTFDLTRHGMVVSGHATQGLPQVMLEVEGDDIYATAVLGLIYGFHDNLVAPA